MNCPNGDMLAAWVDGQVTLDMHQRLTDHVCSCAACAQGSERLRLLAGDLRRLTLAGPAPQFAAQLHARITAQSSVQSRKRPLALAAGCVALIVALGLGLRGMLPTGSQGFAARGGGVSSRELLGVELYSHEGGGSARRLQPGQRISVKAGYSFVLWNRSHAQQYLMLFALDARSQVHWFFPAFLDSSTDPQSLPIAAEPQVQALSEGVTPADPAAGPVQFVALFSRAALHVSEIEERVGAGGLVALRRAYPQARFEVLHAELHAP